MVLRGVAGVLVAEAVLGLVLLRVELVQQVKAVMVVLAW
jgi:hypothetical protein